MTSTVLVKMNTCSKTHRITVSLRDDGDLDLSIVSDCKNVQAYAEKIQKISMDDITEFCNSRLNSPENRSLLSVPCLVPTGIFDAAWMEVGLLSKSLCEAVGSNEVILKTEK